jgi:hypothetical protein
MREADQSTSGERERGELLELEPLARDLRRGRPVDSETRRHNERVAEGQRVTGDVIWGMRTGERPGEGVPVGERARVGGWRRSLG